MYVCVITDQTFKTNNYSVKKNYSVFFIVLKTRAHFSFAFSFSTTVAVVGLFTFPEVLLNELCLLTFLQFCLQLHPSPLRHARPSPCRWKLLLALDQQSLNWYDHLLLSFKPSLFITKGQKYAGNLNGKLDVQGTEPWDL